MSSTPFLTRHFTRLAGGLPGAGRLHDLGRNGFGLDRDFPAGNLADDSETDRLNDRLYFGRDQFVFGLG